ncbi:MAG: hypothetical protein BWY43_00010 [candidate division WS2 bacterium ADurb.Bin280]|uniref:Uncharacterized protein n=1 Tax=candidate division WS2 bacterium ADurb.Bin280 TaxID=1852829 RepID=A0A1V5SG20_9BACT|nr:MAG: hypothetical protein BWY43_00010 [candidate division WS2 bacterium ADurb.Bin280]
MQYKATPALLNWAKTADCFAGARARACAELGDALMKLLAPPHGQAHMLTSLVASLDPLPEVRVSEMYNHGARMEVTVAVGFAFEQPSWNGALEALPGNPAALWDAIVDAIAVARGFTDATDLVAIVKGRVMTAEEFTPGFTEVFLLVASYASEALRKPRLLFAAGREIAKTLLETMGPTTALVGKVAIKLGDVLRPKLPRSGEVTIGCDGEGD